MNNFITESLDKQKKVLISPPSGEAKKEDTMESGDKIKAIQIWWTVICNEK